MHQRRFGAREKLRIPLNGVEDGLAAARQCFTAGAYLNAIDIYEQLAEAYPRQAIATLAELYDRYLLLPERDRYHLYQARHFVFGITPGDKVLDVGSGHLPFPLATHLCDIAIQDHAYGRAGAPFRQVEGKPVYQCPVEALPFADKEFDFVYCSHVLEHTTNPERACRELMRVARRGYIETPTKAKDVFLSSARVSNHTRSVDLVAGKLVFRDYTLMEVDGLCCNILQGMHSNPQTEREKAFAALIWLKADVVNTMLLWEDSFDFEVAGKPAPPAAAAVRLASHHPAPRQQTSAEPVSANRSPLSFLQVHTFYSSYLDDFHERHPRLASASFDQQINALVRDGFSGIHIFAPYMGELGYRPHFVVANDHRSQAAWLRENGSSYTRTADWLHDVVRLQIEALKPEILYLTDPINFDSRFLRTLSFRPTLIVGWRAANIPSGTDWAGFDLMLSSLAPLREVALRLGARCAETFFPGFPCWMEQAAVNAAPLYDVVFCGSWTAEQHAQRNGYLSRLALEASAPDAGFSLALYVNAPADVLPAEVRRYNKGARFGIGMHEALKSGRIVIDARGTIEYCDPGSGSVIDLAQRETANMRIFETTGAGRLLLTEHHDNLSAYFEPGMEIETFRSGDELLEKIRYYLEHPDEREAIAMRGHRRCREEYSMERRAAQFDLIVRSHLTRVDQPAERAPVPAAELVEEARQLLAQGDQQGAFRVLIKAKALKEPVKGVDLLRARCFLAKGEPLAAVEALREELRLFPGNGEAANLLAELGSAIPSTNAGSGGDDQEFRELLPVIRPYTMLSEQRLFSLYTLARAVCQRDVPGNFVECGVAAGGSSALLAFVIRKYSRQPRRLFAFDSFSGMPAPCETDTHGGIDADSTGWGTGTCSAAESSVREICSRLGVDELLTTVPGYFEDTLPSERNWLGMIALLHLDGDWYSSTKVILDNLYHRLVQGAVLQVDDYGYWEGCRKAVHDFEAQHGLRFAINAIDGTGVWFQRPDWFPPNHRLDRELIEEFHADDPAPKGITSQMSINERFQLYYALRRELPANRGLLRFIEIGSYSGASLLLIRQALLRRQAPFQGVAVEPAGTAQFQEVVKMLKGDVLHMPLLSHDAAVRLAAAVDPEQLPQFIFIDGDHSYQGVRQDILDFYPLLRCGGLMLFHDYLPELDERNRDFIMHHHCNTEPGIRRACRELMEETFGCEEVKLPLLYPDDPTQTQPQLPIIPGVYSTIRAYRKTEEG